jgi:hypothetical protein
MATTSWRERLTSFAVWLGQVWCGVRGHDRYLHTTEAGRLTLRCVACSHDTPGWDTGHRAYRRTQDGDTRHKMRRPRGTRKARRG